MRGKQTFLYRSFPFSTSTSFHNCGIPRCRLFLFLKAFSFISTSCHTCGIPRKQHFLISCQMTSMTEALSFVVMCDIMNSLGISCNNCLWQHVFLASYTKLLLDRAQDLTAWMHNYCQTGIYSCNIKITIFFCNVMLSNASLCHMKTYRETSTRIADIKAVWCKALVFCLWSCV